ncbi:MAG: peroxiredoxin family protein [Sphingobacteriaceae bacterium]
MKIQSFRLSAVLFLFTILSACKNSDVADLKNGVWRATLKTETGVEIPFNFELADSAGIKYLDIINGKERFRVNEITQADDTILIQMPLFDSEIKAVLSGNKLTGKWVKHLATKNVGMEFQAEPNANWRFFKANESPAKVNLTGKWSTTFITADEDKDTTLAIGQFTQEGSKLYGTFLTSTGDYRFLEGTVSGDKFYLSCFDGCHAFLFSGKVSGDMITEGKMYSGYSGVENWTAKKDENAVLPDAYSLVSLKPGLKSIDFTFNDLTGKPVSLKDQQFKNKVTVIQFFGSWCPNCMDETAFMVPFYNKYKDKGFAVIGLGYERSTDVERARTNIGRLKDRFQVPYPLLITGYINKPEEVIKSIPMLNAFMAFPTTIIIDKKGEVRKIHTGFSGPGTGKYYTEFAEEFEKLIQELLAEK